jgi:GWxTD domain-containing protein
MSFVIWAQTPSSAPAVSASVPKSKFVRFSMDQASFNYTADQSLLEVYLSFDVKSLPFTKAADGFEARVPLMIEVLRNRGKVNGETDAAVHRDAMQLAFPAADTTGLTAGQVFMYVLRQAVPAGEYELNVKVLPDPSRNLAEVEQSKQIVVRRFDEPTKVQMSDVNLALNIEPSQDKNDAFYRNGLNVQPNPSVLFGNGLDRLFYYTEAYHLNTLKTDPAQTQYTLFTYIAEANTPQPIGDLQSKVKRPIQDTDVLYGVFDLSNLPSGSYFLRMAILNDNNEAVSEQSKKFYIYNPNQTRKPTTILDPEEDFLGSVYVNMPEAELNEAIEQAKVIMSAAEERVIKNARTTDVRRRALYDFWKNRDSNPLTSGNETKQQYYELIRIAIERYSSKFAPGWKTERGRILLKYGLPTGTEQHLNSRDTAPYEVWEYSNIPGEGRSIFVFADMSGFGEFELIHSNVSGLKKSLDWQTEIKK